MIKLFSAFAGYGTDIFALKQLGIEFECVGFSEIDKYAIMCFEKNHCFKFPDMLKGEITKPHNFGDISRINWEEVPDFDLITGGFPCQDVSVAGKQDLNKGRTILGMELTKALKIKQPKYFLFENVKGLMSKKFDNFRKQLVKSWEDCGYKIYSEILNTKDYGIPQSRARVFFVGIKKPFCCNKYMEENKELDEWYCDECGNIEHLKKFEFPKKEELKIFIKDILEKEVDDKYLLKEHQINKLLEGIKTKMRSKIGLLQEKDYCDNIRARDYKEPKVVQIDISGKGYHSQEDRFYNVNGVMCCLPNSNTSSKVNIFVIQQSPIFRRLTPKECFRLQGFLKDEVNLNGLSDTQAYRLAGNGQSVNVVVKIFTRLLNLKDKSP